MLNVASTPYRAARSGRYDAPMSSQPSAAFMVWASTPTGEKIGSYGVLSIEAAEAKAAELRRAGYMVEITASQKPTPRPSDA